MLRRIPSELLVILVLAGFFALMTRLVPPYQAMSAGAVDPPSPRVAAAYREITKLHRIDRPARLKAILAELPEDEAETLRNATWLLEQDEPEMLPIVD